MNKSFRTVLIVSVLALYSSVCPSSAEELPPGYWTVEQSQQILNKTLTIHLNPSLDHLTASERQAVDKLIEVGKIFQSIFEDSRHHQATRSHTELIALDQKLKSPQSTQNLLNLYRLFRGPIANTLQNSRQAFLPVDDIVPGKNVYPWGIEKSELEAFVADDNPHSSLLGVRTVVRRAVPENIRLDRAMMLKHPTLETLHPQLGPHLESLLVRDSKTSFYSVPYSVAYAEQTMRAFNLLFEAAALMQESDASFARYLRNRARDLLSNDYESGDASWVTGRFKKLNAQIGAYEVYDDELYATKAFYSMSLLLRDEEQSNALREAIQGIQDFEDKLPYDHHKSVREDIPVSVYNVIADFGQSRGTNTATILPNEAYLTRKYGRTILLRYNIMTQPDLFANSKQIWDAAISISQQDDFKSTGNFYRTLWHEIGHYLAADLTRDGIPVDEALEENSSAFEEMKADLVSLFLAKLLHEKGYYDQERLKAVYASGIRRVLRNNKPRRSQSYAVMQLMQFNYFLENGLLEYEPKTKRLMIHYELYDSVVENLLREVIAIQYNGDKQASDNFIDRYTAWQADLHDRLAANMRNSQKYRYRLVWYGALGE